MSHAPSPATDDSDSFILSTTPTPAPLKSFSQWSASDAHHQGTSYYSQPPSPILNRARRTTRSTSVASSHATNRQRDDEIQSEDDEDHSRRRGKAPAESPDDENSGEGDDIDEDDPITTVKDRQSLINVQHPFGLPIWKPALYKKSRTVTRLADEALHSIPSAQAERHLLPGNLFWALAFGWWLGLICIVISFFLYLVPQGDQHYSNLVYGLGWYLAWPFGKYLEGDINELEAKDDDEGSPPRHWIHPNDTDISQPRQGDEIELPKNPPLSQYSTITPDTVLNRGQNISWASEPARESTPLLGHQGFPSPSKSYGTTVPPFSTSSRTVDPEADYNGSLKGNLLGKVCFWLALVLIIAPLMLFVCMICWFLVVTIPMAKLNWALIQYLFTRPTQIRFCAAPPVVIVSSADEQGGSRSEHEQSPDNEPPVAQFSVKHPRLSAGQAAPSGSPTSTVLLCTYRAVGFKFYKYTVGGVNILFVNLLPIVFFVIFDGFLLRPLVEEMERNGHVPAFLGFIASESLIFILCLTSVIPLSYFIGMAVASISAQSSIGMGAVINATFGSIIEIILYGMALMQGKGHLVEGSIVGSLLAGVLLMPGMSMCSGALRRKEQKFNAKSAGVTSMMLIMAIIGALTPTLFYQTYGNFQLVCSGCPSTPGEPGNAPWICDHCYYKHPDPVDDPFYQSTVKSLMYFCAVILLLSYLIGLWFSLRTHATQIWQNPQQLLHPMELPSHRISQYNKLATTTGTTLPASLSRRDSNVARGSSAPSRTETPLPRESSTSTSVPPQAARSSNRKLSYASQPQQTSLRPVLESVDHAVKNANLQNIQLPESMTTDDFTRAVAVATVSALRHQQQAHSHSPGRVRSAAEPEGTGAGGHGGHDAPSWSRTTSASVLLACTALYALIAELLVDVVDVILKGSGIQEKFLGITLFALVPNTTEFMNAISFALNGNIALSMEIGSAYALQVCLLQIPAMVAFSAWYDPVNMGESAKTFSLIFPRWDVIAIILSMFLMTYTYIEAKSNYHRGSILILSYLVLLAGFYSAPPTAIDVDQGHLNGVSSALREFPALSWFQTARWYLQSLFQRGT